MILTDSQATLTALDTIKTNSKTVENLKAKINLLAESNIVELSWIPGHRGYEGNERADKLAKIATTKQNTANEPITHGNLIDVIKKHFQRQTNTRWKNTIVGDNSKLILNNIIRAANNNMKNVQKASANLSTHDIWYLVRSITDKNCLNANLIHSGKEYTDKCSYCGDINKPHHSDEVESTIHILCECAVFSNIRQTMFGHFKLDPEKNDMIIKNNCKRTMMRIIEFMKKIKVLSRSPRLKKSQLYPRQYKYKY